MRPACTWVPSCDVLAGSGPTDRDWNSPLLPGDHGSGAALARALARHGVVVLRYDKRGTGATELPKDKPVQWDDYMAELEAMLVPGKGKFTYTGQLGDVMQESVKANTVLPD